MTLNEHWMGDNLSKSSFIIVIVFFILLSLYKNRITKKYLIELVLGREILKMEK